MSNRTDVHAPKNFIPEDYEYAYSYDAHPEEGDQRFTWPILNALIAEGWHFEQVHGGDTCDHCGARLRYVAVMKHLPSHTLIKVGETCLDNRFGLATAEFHKLRKAAKLNRERAHLATQRRENLEKFLADPEAASAYEWAKARVEADDDWGFGDFGDEPGFRYNFVRTVEKYGEVSEKFMAAMLRDMAKTTEREAKRAAERAALEANGKPCPTGKHTVIGEIIKLDVSENAYGSREVMTVRTDDGYKIWGTQPTKLYDAMVGARVTFTATLEPSERDEFFGFFKRPTKPAVLSGPLRAGLSQPA